jgi:simple sugar transport system substrate-binding protein
VRDRIYHKQHDHEGDSRQMAIKGSQQSHGSRGTAVQTVIACTAILGLVTACATNTKDTNTKDAKTGSGTAAALKSGLGSRAKNRNVTFILHQDPADPFIGTIAQGARDAAALFNLNLNLETALGDQVKYVDLVTKAADSKPAGLAVVLDDPKLYTKAVCDAQKAGIAVIAFNITQPGTAVAKCTLAFVGQDFRAVGRLVGERLLADHPEIKKGDLVFGPVEFPDEYYAKERGGGVQEALDKVGAKLAIVGVDIDDAGALAIMTQYLLAHRGLKAITPLGGTPHRNIVQAMKDSGVVVPVVGFDVSPSIVAGIKSGAIDATADQQGYVQGFQSVAELALYLDFGLSPANINSGGSGLIDKTNLGVVEELAGKVR